MGSLKPAKGIVTTTETLLSCVLSKGQCCASLYALSHLILRTKLCERQYHYFHFEDQATETGNFCVLL